MLLLSGNRSNGITRQFHLSQTFPHDEKDVTAVMGIPFIGEQVVLTRTHRGRELPGGHVERAQGETLEQAFDREVYEESGVQTYTNKRLLGYRTIHNTIAKINKATGAPYPEVGYILYYTIDTTDYMPQPPAPEEDALEAKLCSITDPEVIESGGSYPILIAAATRRCL